MPTQILKVAMIAAMLACAVGIAAFARGAYDYSPPVREPGARGAVDHPG